MALIVWTVSFIEWAKSREGGSRMFSRTRASWALQARNSQLGLVASWINLDLAQILHRFPPELVKTVRQTVREFAIPDE
jgi:hypothetical protein